MERAQVEVIEVRVREQDEIDRRQLLDAQRRRSEAFRSQGKARQANADAREKNGIGQDVKAAEIKQHTGVAEPGSGDPVVRPGVRLGSGKGGRHWPARFHGALAQEMAQPARDASAPRAPR